MSKKFILEIRPFGNSCNRNCPHCYQIKTNIGTGSLPFAGFQKALLDLKNYLEISRFDYLKIVFHGGEPLVDRGKWILAALNLIERYLPFIRINYLIHTHGFHKEQVVAQFLERKIGFGMSVVLPTNEKLKVSDLPPTLLYIANRQLLYSVQVVIRPYIGLTSLEDLLDLLPSKLNVKLIPCISTNNQEALTPNAYSQELLYVADRLQSSDAWEKFFIEPVSWVRAIGEVRERFRGCRFLLDECNLKANDLVTLAIDCDGFVYACNRFAGVQRYPLSSIYEPDWLGKAKQSVKNLYTQVYRSAIARENCGNCIAYTESLCLGSGGCPFHAILCHKTNAEDPYCYGEQTLVEYYQRSRPQKQGRTKLF